MTYIRRRSTKAGSVSTALVESYRDDKGRPRQRLLANLHGEPDIVSALAKLEFRWDNLSKQKDEWAEDQARSEDDELMAAEFFGDRLAATENEISVIKKHCSATPGEIQVAIAAHKIALERAVALAQGAFMSTWPHEDAYKAAKVKLRRMRT
jgi:hypothetical protein